MSQEPSFFLPGSVTRKIHSDPAMAVAGIRALLQQALHPAAMAGVAKYSDFRNDTWGRLKRTSDYVNVLTFGPIQQAQALSSRIRSVHSKLGVDDPELLLWVHMAMVDSFLDCAIRSGLVLTNNEQDQYLLEMVRFAELVGLDRESVPANVKEMKDYFLLMMPSLAASDDAKRSALFLTFPPMSPKLRFATPAAPAWTYLASLASASLPVWARKMYGVPSLPGHEIITDLSLKTVRKSLTLIPKNLLPSSLQPTYFEDLVGQP